MANSPLAKTVKEEFIRAFLFASFLALFVATYAFAAVSYPSTSPNSEVAGGRFADVLNRILANHNYQTDTTGVVANSAALGGVAADQWQQKLKSSCPANQGIQSIDQQGNVTCN